ncbi:DUF3105 domain-containing protein [Streptomyces sp. NPDC092952]|uniref:DUF3105 domain-containing protein n=1 Tax=Streptomyces sp. NPDC092952 TaxID=3366018 RepID=UPI0037FEAD20
MSFAPHNPVDQPQDAYRPGGRRDRALAIGLSVLVVLGLVGFGSYLVLTTSEASEQKPSTPADGAMGDGKAPATGHGGPTGKPDGKIEGLRSWDASKLTRNHVNGPVTYPMKPPVGGDHNPVWMNCDGAVYPKAIPDVNAVHALEHGSVWVTYTAKAPRADLDKLSERVSRTPYSLMSPYADQSGTIMLTAWGKQLTVDGADDPRVDQFFSQFVQGPQTPEPGATCSGGLEAP